MSRNGETVREFERQFAAYVGARYCIAMANGTATLHTALVALGVKPGDRVAVPPLTMSSTTIAVLHAGGVPVFTDVRADTWVMQPPHYVDDIKVVVPVDLYGLWCHRASAQGLLTDAAQTLRQANGEGFTSYSFQASKILSCGEGGALVTNDEELATKARSFSSLGYKLDPKSPRIDPSTIKSPHYERHHVLGWNYRMSDLQAERLLVELGRVERLLEVRRLAAGMYRDAISGTSWLVPQHVPDGWTHDYWSYAVAVQPEVPYTPEVVTARLNLANFVERHGGERPYAAWRLAYQEPGLATAKEATEATKGGLSSLISLSSHPSCPIAESLQPRLLQFQTNNLESAEKNASALAKAIKEIGG